MSNSNLRPPRPHYQGRNGFQDSPPTGVIMESDELELALDKHRLAMFTLTQKDRPIPSLEAMQKELDIPEDSAYIKQRILETRKDHERDLERLLIAQGEEYLDDVDDNYLSRDEEVIKQAFKSTRSDNINTYNELERTLENAHENPMHLQFGWENEYARTRYAYLQHLIYLRKTKAELEAREEEARRRKNAQFPQSIEDFYSVNREVRMRVVRFLTSDKIGKERMLNEFGWAHLQVKPLVMEYEKNKTFSREVRERASAFDVRDPRRKPTF